MSKNNQSMPRRFLWICVKHSATFSWRLAEELVPPGVVRVGIKALSGVMNAKRGWLWWWMGVFQYPLQKLIAEHSFAPRPLACSASMFCIGQNVCSVALFTAQYSTVRQYMAVGRRGTTIGAKTQLGEVVFLSNPSLRSCFT